MHDRMERPKFSNDVRRRERGTRKEDPLSFERLFQEIVPWTDLDDTITGQRYATLAQFPVKKSSRALARKDDHVIAIEMLQCVDRRLRKRQTFYHHPHFKFAIHASAEQLFRESLA